MSNYEMRMGTQTTNRNASILISKLNPKLMFWLLSAVYFQKVALLQGYVELQLSLQFNFSSLQSEKRRIIVSKLDENQINFLLNVKPMIKGKRVTTVNVSSSQLRLKIKILLFLSMLRERKTHK